jgi:hypothetical protein
MQVHPALAALRQTGALPPGCDAALTQWRSAPVVAAIIDALAAFSRGAGLAALPALARLFTDRETAQGVADSLIGALLPVLRAAPLAQPGLGHSAIPGVQRLRLATHGRAALTLSVFDRREETRPDSALFEDCEVHEIVLAGTGLAAQHQRGNGTLTTRLIACTPGTCLARTGDHQARQIIAVSRPLLVLQLSREPATPGPSREIALADGAVIKVISGCKRTSQQMMALAVLGALEHAPAADTLELLAHDRARAPDLRWEALRQCLGLDARRGLAVLALLAEAADDPLADAAALLQRDLAASHRVLMADEAA